MKRPNFSWKYAALVVGLVVMAYLVMNFNNRIASLRRLSIQRDAVAARLEGLESTQLQNFRSGVRGTHEADLPGAQMRAAVTALRDDAAAFSVAAYVAALPKTTVKAAARAVLRNGNNLYQGKCGACHGGKAEGNTSLSTPRLAGLDATYLKRQYRHFRDGVRGAHPQDRYGRQMSLMANALPTDRDLDDVIAFIHFMGATP